MFPEEPWRPLDHVADSHHLDEDPDPHKKAGSGFFILAAGPDPNQASKK